MSQELSVCLSRNSCKSFFAPAWLADGLMTLRDIFIVLNPETKMQFYTFFYFEEASSEYEASTSAQSRMKLTTIFQEKYWCVCSQINTNILYCKSNLVGKPRKITDLRHVWYMLELDWTVSKYIDFRIIGSIRQAIQILPASHA